MQRASDTTIRNLGGLRLLVLMAVIAVSCGGGSDHAATDSEGVLDLGEPVVVVGVTDTLAGHALHRVVGARWTSVGELVIADNGSGELRVFDDNGRLVRTLGRKGAGPGEHQSLAGIWAAGDTLISYDFSSARLSYWKPNGDFLRDVPLPRRGDIILGRFADGYMIGRSMPSVPTGTAVGTRWVDSVEVYVADPQTQASNSLGLMPLQTRYAAQLPGGGTIYTGLPLYPTSTFAVAGDVFFAGFGHEGRVRRFSSAGDALADLTWTAPVEPLTPDRRAAWQEPILESVRGRAEEPHMQSYLSALPYPDALPAYDRLQGDDTGKLWVRSYPVPAADSTLWRVLESDGTVVARVTMPVTLQLLHVGVDFLVASDTDVDGQERVVVWRLRR